MYIWNSFILKELKTWVSPTYQAITHIHKNPSWIRCERLLHDLAINPTPRAICLKMFMAVTSWIVYIVISKKNLWGCNEVSGKNLMILETSKCWDGTVCSSLCFLQVKYNGSVCFLSWDLHACYLASKTRRAPSGIKLNCPTFWSWLMPKAFQDWTKFVESLYGKTGNKPQSRSLVFGLTLPTRKNLIRRFYPKSLVNFHQSISEKEWKESDW